MFIPSRHRLSFLLLAGLLTMLGCTPSEPRPRGVVARWIEHDPQTFLSASAMVGTRLTEDLCSPSPETEREWRGHDVVIHDPGDGTLEIERHGPDPWVAVNASLDADAIVAVEVELTNPGPAETQLFWASRWQRFSMRRMVRPNATVPTRTGGVRARFEVGNHPQWGGTLRSLRIDLAPGGTGTVRLTAVRLYRWETDDEHIDEIAERPWKIELERSTKNSLLTPPGAGWEKSLTVPDQAILVASYGLQRHSAGSTTFRITADDGTDPASLVFEDTIGQEDQWFRAVAELGALAGRRVTLRLTADSGRSGPPARGLPVWGNPEVLAPSDDAGRPNVVVILLDTLRADRLSCYGHALETSPKIDAWAGAEAVRFANVVAPAPWTLPSHVSLFTGLDALRHGFDSWGAAPEGFEMAAEVFRRNGYATAAITGGGVVHPSLGFAQGFDRFDAWDEPDSEDEVGWVFARARRWLDNHSDRRFFLFVHTYETHAPHRRRQPHFRRLARQAGVRPDSLELDLVTRPWDGLVAEGDRFTIRRAGTDAWSTELTENELETVGLMYDSAVATVDAKVGALLDHIAHLGLDDNTVVVITSDHGEALGEDGRAGHVYLEDYNLLVPLLIALPGGLGDGRVIDDQVRLIDIVPTLYDIADVKPHSGSDGRSLRPLIAGEANDFPHHAWAYAASSNRGLALRLDNRLKYVFPDAAWAEVRSRERFHDLVADPGEATNLAPDDPRLDGIRTTTRETILDQHRGLRLEIRNASSATLSGKLTGAWAAHNRVKTAHHSRESFHWSPRSGASFRIEAGERSILLFTRLRSPDAGLEIHADPDDQQIIPHGRVTIDLATLETPAVIRPVDGRWTLEPATDDGLETGFLITRVGPPQPLVAEGLPVESDVVEQLEALGYLE